MNTDANKLSVIKHRCEHEHLFFVRYFFKQRMGDKFLTNWHHHLIAYEIDRLIQRAQDGLETENIIFNLPPGGSKTEMAMNIIPRGLALNPRSRFLYLSFSDRLVTDVSATARTIVKSRHYQELWPVAISSDTDAKGSWKTDIEGFEGGHIYAASMGGQVTGRRAGRMSKDFNGCFPAWERVITNKGSLSFEEIKNYKGELKALSMNVDNGELEYQPIDKLWVNPANDIYGVILNDGSYFEATSDHKIMTANGYVQVKDLTAADVMLGVSSSVLDDVHANPQEFADVFSLEASVEHDINLFGRILSSIVPVGVRKVVSGSLPCFPCFDLSDDRYADTVSFSEFFCGLGASKYLNGLLLSEFSPGSSFHQRKGAVSDSILHVVGLSAIGEIFKSIVLMITVEMANLFFVTPLSEEGFQDKLMDVCRFNLRVFAEANPEIAMTVLIELEYFFGKLIRTAFSIYESVEAFNSTQVADGVKTFVTRNRKPLFISKVGHVDKTFCLSVRSNYNFTLSQSKVIVSNCLILDDPLKPEDAFSDTKRKAANRKLLNTVKSRKAKSDTPIILIMQRLHGDDPTQFILDGNMGGKWRHVNIPALIDDAFIKTLPPSIAKLVPTDVERDDKGRQSYWSAKESLLSLLELEQGGSDKDGQKVSRYTFHSQYMQTPTKLGGGLIKASYFGRYTALPKLKWLAIFADTAQKTKEVNDYSVFMAAGEDYDGNLVIVDVLRGKWEAPELIVKAGGFIKKHNDNKDTPNLRYVAIEDKASGTGLIQTLKTTSRISIKAVQRNTDKLTRFMDAHPYIEDGIVYLPLNANWVGGFIDEAEAFSADMSHDHDDQIDPLIDLINIGRQSKSVFDVVG